MGYYSTEVGASWLGPRGSIPVTVPVGTVVDEIQE